MRKKGRKHDEIRSVSIQLGFQPHADGSVLITLGDTCVACSVTIEESVPPFLKNCGQGWLTAEYGMLPCATHQRTPRESVRGRQGRTYEIQRLIGRSLRAMVNLARIGENTLRIDCDVIKADGGTRTASITGAALAVRQALNRLQERGMVSGEALITPVAAISVGLVDDKPLLDLDYEEDSKADVDANFVMTNDGGIIEIQCAAEGRPFNRKGFDSLADLAGKGISQLFHLWEPE